MAKVKAKCWCCTKIFLAEAKELNRGNGKFCSLSCAAAYGNILRRKAKPLNHTCFLCGNRFYRKASLIRRERVYCSKKCFYEATHPLYSRARLIEIIKKFYEERGRIPLHKEFNADTKYPNPETYKAAFGSWNAGIEAAGFDPNGSSLGRVCVAKDGHKCRSFAERIIDDWLFQNGIPHEKEVLYPDSRLRADWRIGSTFVEYLGLSLDGEGELYEHYRLALERKRSICLASKMPLIELYYVDLSELSVKLNCLVAYSGLAREWNSFPGPSGLS